MVFFIESLGDDLNIFYIKNIYFYFMCTGDLLCEWKKTVALLEMQSQKLVSLNVNPGPLEEQVLFFQIN